MNYYILAGVGTAQLFDKTAQSNLIVNARTFTESSVKISLSAEDIRGGLSNPLLGKYFHDTILESTLTDALFNLQYLAMNVGGDITVGGTAIAEETLTDIGTADTITVTGTPVAFGNAGTVGWYSLQGENSWHTITFEGKTAHLTGSTLPAGSDVCVKYNATDNTMDTFIISSAVIPSEVHAVLTFPLFSAGTQNFTSAYQVGELIVDIPRFLLNGEYELNLTSTGAATSALSGNALTSYSSTGCNDLGQYATVSQKIYDTNKWEGLSTLAIDNADIQLSANDTTTLKVWGVYYGGTSVSTSPIDNAELTFTSGTQGTATVDNAGVITAVATGTSQIKCVVRDTASTSNPIEAYANVTVS